MALRAGLNEKQLKEWVWKSKNPKDFYGIDFMLQTTPIIIKGATGGPVVACAYIPQYS